MFSMIYAGFTGDRLLIQAFPAYLILLGIVIQDKSDILKENKWLCVVLIIAQRVFLTMPIDIPNEPQLTPPDAQLLSRIYLLPLLLLPFLRHVSIGKSRILQAYCRCTKFVIFIYNACFPIWSLQK